MDKVTIKIPRVLYNKIQQLISDSGFNSPTDFIVYVLRDMVSDAGISSEDDALKPDELKRIKQKLKNLGYL
ncbi:MAG: CopG family transcriptional regulator [Candidatus Schekmanbacteria bacterium]|nr:MAG: CopG family transcriptional regulator [Candidatus Schekmanbacteria bacterium]